MWGRLTLQRRESQTAVRDNLTYEYYAFSNKLKNVDGTEDENYTYDEIGNLIADEEEGIAEIQWTPYGKVRKVIKDDNSEVHFRYDASGNRIAKITATDTTVYARDASGNVMAVYKGKELEEQSIYGSSRLGLINYASKTGYRSLGGKKYELSNHLGNVLAVVSDNIHLDQDSTWTSLINTTDYYPFGLAMDGRSVQDSAYRYGFNGKELDGNGEWGGQNNYDYGFRIYNPRIAKFLSVDPLTPDYPWYTPYQFAGNMPIWAIDLDGKEPWITNSISYLNALFTGYQQKLQKATNGYIAAQTNSGDFNHASIPNDLRTINNTLVKLESAKAYAEVFIEGSEFTAETIGSIPGVETFGDALIMTYHGLKGNDEDAMAYAAGLLIPGVSGKVVKEMKGPLHHIFTNKNFKRGQQWSKKFMPLFEKAGYTLNNAINKIHVPGHFGPHPDEYHQHVYDQLIGATEGLKGKAYKDVFEKTIDALGKEAQTAGTKLNKLLTKVE